MILRHPSALWKIYLSVWSRKLDESAGSSYDLLFSDDPDLADDVSKHCCSGDFYHSLYFVVFGSAIGTHIADIGGVSYGAFIVPGLIMLSLLTQSISNASFAIYFPKFTGTIYELLSAPCRTLKLCWDMSVQQQASRSFLG